MVDVFLIVLTILQYGIGPQKDVNVLKELISSAKDAEDAQILLFLHKETVLARMDLLVMG